jgi:hypothetical protein
MLDSARVQCHRAICFAKPASGFFDRLGRHAGDFCRANWIVRLH